MTSQKVFGIVLAGGGPGRERARGFTVTESGITVVGKGVLVEP